MKKRTLFAMAAIGLGFNLAWANHSDEEASGSTVRIKTSQSGSPQCLDLDRATNSNGAKVQRNPCLRPSPSGFSEQDFYVTKNSSGFYEIKFAKSGKCLEVRGKAKGANVEQQTCGGLASQQFELIADANELYQIRARHSAHCLGIPLSPGKSGVALGQVQCEHEDDNQLFQITEGY